MKVEIQDWKALRFVDFTAEEPRQYRRSPKESTRMYDERLDRKKPCCKIMRVKKEPLQNAKFCGGSFLCNGQTLYRHYNNQQLFLFFPLKAVRNGFFRRQ